MSAIKLLQSENVKVKFQEMLWENAGTYLTTVMSIIANNDMLKDADPQSVYLASLNAASLKLPVNPNLWFAYILPYKGKDKTTAQFQLGYKWFIQLAQRSHLYKTISACPVFEWQLVEENPLTWYVFDWKNKLSDKVVWYAWYFSLLDWFEKTMYMTRQELEKHWKKYSQTFKRWYWLRETDFDAMATKTVIKLLISKYWPLSVDMERAIITDQSVIKSEVIDDVEYIDNTQEIIESTVTTDEDLLADRCTQLNECKTIWEIDALYRQNKPTNPQVLSLFTTRKNELNSTNI